jgi:cytochrome c553
MARDIFTWRHAGFRWSVGALLLLTVLSMLIGFVWLPSAQRDFTAGGLWEAICRAAGVPREWGDALPAGTQPPRATDVVLTRSMTRADTGAVGRGATLALNCTMCHGALGMSASNSPNLAGQYPEVVIKQLRDYQSGKRTSAVMEALAKQLSEQNIADLAAYYASLPRARTAPTTYDESLPALVRVGDPLRNIAPCISCHGGVDQKFGAPWLEGMPKAYLVAQLRAFADGTRRNDPHAQMRNVARPMTAQEIDEVAAFYARKAARAGVAGH